MAKNLTIQDEPVYNEQMEALEPTTPAHADYFNERYAQLLNNGKANRRDAKIFEDDVNGGKMRLGIDKICEALDCTITDLLEYIPNERKTTGKYLILEEHGNRKQKKEKD